MKSEYQVDLELNFWVSGQKNIQEPLLYVILIEVKEGFLSSVSPSEATVMKMMMRILVKLVLAKALPFFASSITHSLMSVLCMFESVPLKVLFSNAVTYIPPILCTVL